MIHIPPVTNTITGRPLPRGRRSRRGWREGTRRARRPPLRPVHAPAGEVEVEAIARGFGPYLTSRTICVVGRKTPERDGVSCSSETTRARLRAGRWVGDTGRTGRLKIEIDTRRGAGREKGAHLLVRVVHPRDAEERGERKVANPTRPKNLNSHPILGGGRARGRGVNLDGWNVGRDTRETTGRGSTRAPEEGREAHGEPEGHHDVSTDRGDERGRAFGETRHPPRVARRAPRSANVRC